MATNPIVFETMKALSDLTDEKIEAFANSLRRSPQGTIWTLGNGGSAALASHFAQDLMKACGMRAICLNDSVPFITAVSNDNEYEEAGAWGIQIHGSPGDALVLISGSGTSPNLIHAAQNAKARGMSVFVICTYTVPTVADYFIRVGPNEKRDMVDMMVAENCHTVACHAIIDKLGGYCAGRDETERTERPAVPVDSD